MWYVQMARAINLPFSISLRRPSTTYRTADSIDFRMGTCSSRKDAEPDQQGAFVVVDEHGLGDGSTAVNQQADPHDSPARAESATLESAGSRERVSMSSTTFRLVGVAKCAFSPPTQKGGRLVALSV
jgi:hypothetical protein